MGLTRWYVPGFVGGVRALKRVDVLGADGVRRIGVSIGDELIDGGLTLTRLGGDAGMRLTQWRPGTSRVPTWTAEGAEWKAREGGLVVSVQSDAEPRVVRAWWEVREDGRRAVVMTHMEKLS